MQQTATLLTMGSEILIALLNTMLKFIKARLISKQNVNFWLNLLYSYDGTTTRRRRERSKRSHHRRSPESERKSRRHRKHRHEYNTRNNHYEQRKEREERTPVKVMHFLIFINFKKIL